MQLGWRCLYPRDQGLIRELCRLSAYLPDTRARQRVLGSFSEEVDLRLSHDEIVTCVDGWDQSQGSYQSGRTIPTPSQTRSSPKEDGVDSRDDITVKVRSDSNVKDPIPASAHITSKRVHFGPVTLEPTLAP
jgi:hypothetical protein